MKPQQLMKAGGAVRALSSVDHELRRVRDDRVRELDESVQHIEDPREATDVLTAKRNAAYANMHSLLHALWNAPESEALGLRRRGSGSLASERPISAPDCPKLVLHSDGKPEPDPKGEHSYGLDYDLDYSLGFNRVGAAQPLQGLGEEQTVFSEAKLLAKIEGPSPYDPRGHRYPIDKAADFLENVDTLARLCEAAGVQIPDSVPAPIA